LTKQGAEAIQEGGTHYKGMPIEPLRFAMENNWDACAFSILKYVSRHRLKNGLEDIKKAGHYVRLRMELWSPWNYPRGAIRIPAIRYCQANKISGSEMLILFALESWVHDHSRMSTHVTEISRHLDKLTRLYEGYQGTDANRN
jgi:hypothetical protein